MIALTKGQSYNKIKYWFLVMLKKLCTQLSNQFLKTKLYQYCGNLFSSIIRIK